MLSIVPVNQNYVSPAKGALNAHLTPYLSLVCVHLVNDYLNDDVDLVFLFLKTIALSHIQDPAIAKSIEDDARQYGQTITRIDLSRTKVSYFYGMSPQPEKNWFEKRLSEVCTRFFPKLVELPIPSEVTVLLFDSCNARLQDGALDHSYSIYLSQMPELGCCYHPDEIIRTTYQNNQKFSVAIPAKIKEVEQSLETQFASHCSIDSKGLIEDAISSDVQNDPHSPRKQ